MGRPSIVARRIQQIRESKNLSRQDLADRLSRGRIEKTTRLQVWRVETGVVELNAAEVPRWARALESEIADLYATAKAS